MFSLLQPLITFLDRVANASYRIIIEGTSYRERRSPHRVEMFGALVTVSGKCGYV